MRRRMQLDESTRQRAAVVDRVADRPQRRGEVGAMREDPAHAELHALGLVEVFDVDAGNLDRSDARHPMTSW